MKPVIERRAAAKRRAATQRLAELIHCTLMVTATALIGPCLLPSVYAAAPPPLMLANVFEDAAIDVRDYLVSEKYDGIRAYWNGTQLLTRAGHSIRTPEWFIADWPAHALDGELWIERGKFEQLLATVRDEIPDELAWRDVRFKVFDLPSNALPLTDRLVALEDVVQELNRPWVQLVRHWRVSDQDSLQSNLKEIVAAGGEGLMLHRASSLYHAQRSDDLLKMKPYADAEAQVTAHVPGKGKFDGMMGSLEVKNDKGVTFRIGSGFTDEQRLVPPPVGAWITYRYRGLTSNGIPRFASFVRVRD
jgi:DNA ligase 1